MRKIISIVLLLLLVSVFLIDAKNIKILELTSEKPLASQLTPEFADVDSLILVGELQDEDFRVLDSLRVRVMPSGKERETYYEIVYDKLQQLIPFRNQFIEWVELQIVLLDDGSLGNVLKDLIPRFAELKSRSQDLSSWTEGLGIFDLPGAWIHEVLIYIVALLIKTKRDGVLHDLLFSRYYMVNGKDYYKKGFYGIGVLWCRAESFGLRNHYLKLNRMDAFADWIKDHVNARFATFEQLMEADGVLCLSSILKEKSAIWYPRTYVYADWGNCSLELFDAARDSNYAKRLVTILGESDIGSLKSKIGDLAKNHSAYFGDTVHYLLNTLEFEKWGTLQ